MKNSMKDTTCLGGKTTVHEISKVESPDPVKRKPLLKIKEGTSSRKVLNILIFGMFAMGFGLAAVIALVASGPIDKWFFKVVFAGMVIAEITMILGCTAMYNYIVGKSEEDKDSTDTGPTKHPSDLADHLTHEKYKRGGGGCNQWDK